MGRIKQRRRKARMVKAHNRRKPHVPLTWAAFEQRRVNMLTELFALPADLMVEKRCYARYS